MKSSINHKKRSFNTGVFIVLWTLILVFSVSLIQTMVQGMRVVSKTETSKPLSSVTACDGLGTWVPLPSTGGVLASGNYYLNGNVTLDTNITISSGSVNIDLNGYILWGAINADTSVFTVSGGSLNIYDCDTSNRVHNYKIKTVYSDSTQDVYFNDALYSNKLFQRYYDFNDVGDGVIVGGIITGGHKYATKTDLKSNFYYPGGGSAILIGNGGIVRMYGGSLSGNTSTALSQWGGKRERSGTVGVTDGGTFHFYEGQIVGNSSRYGGAGIYLFGSSSLPARVNIYGGVIEDNYAFDTSYNFSNTSSMWVGGAGVSTDNIGNGASIVSLAGTPRIVNNQYYDYHTNDYIKTNLSYSTEAVNSIKILDKLYTDDAGIRTYASIGLWGGAGEQLTSDYTTSGNTHDDVNKVFFADNIAQAVAYNPDNGELKYVTVDLKTLTYASNNGSMDTLDVSVVDKISVSPVMFTKVGHVFVHWNTAPDDSGTVYQTGDIVTLTSDQTVYAIWTKANYSIQYWTNGGTFSNPVQTAYTYGDTVTLPIPNWDGNTFEGWYTNALLTGEPITVLDSSTYGNQVLYAKWAGVTAYTITSSAGQHGSIFPLGSIIYDGISQDYQIIPMNGYKIATFMVDGIDQSENVVNHQYVLTNVTKDIQIDVTFEKIVSSDITIFASSDVFGSISPDGYIVVTSGSNMTYQMTPNVGYVIEDVQVNGESIGAVSSVVLTNINTPQSVYVTFKPMPVIQSNLTFILNGGKTQAGYDLPTEYIEGIGLTLPSAPKVNQAFHTFLGWYDTVQFDGEPMTWISLTDHGDKTFYAKWAVNASSLIFNSNGGSEVSTIEGHYGDVVVEPTDPTKLGYTFIGWYQDALLTSPYTFDTLPGEATTLYAKWVENNYTMTFESNGGSIINDITQAFGSIVLKPTDPTKLGYTFEGWFTDESGTNAYDFITMPAEDIVLYAKWTVNEYTITFETQGGSTVANITLPFGSDVIKPEDPTKLGYNFYGWYSSIQPLTAYTFSTMPAENVTVYAVWDAIPYAITYNCNGGSDVYTRYQSIGTPVIEPEQPTKLGHTFVGWYSDELLTMPYTFAQMPAESFTLYAKWTVNEYTITFETQGGSTVANITLPFGSDVIKPEDPTKLGYNFYGWYSSIQPLTAYTFSTMPAENVTVYAVWDAIPYAITYNCNGGSDVYTRYQSIGTPVIEPEQPTKLGHTFVGWYSDELLTMPYTFAQMQAESFTLYAKWTVNEYTITFDSVGGSFIQAMTLPYDAIVNEPIAPTKLGHTFEGWYTDETGTNAYEFTTMPAENVTLYGKWTINIYTISFDTKGGTNISSLNVPYGSTLEQPTDPTKTGYTFNGWQINLPNTMPANDLNLVAYWLKNTATMAGDVTTNNLALMDIIDASLLRDKDAEVVIQMDYVLSSTVTTEVLNLIETHVHKNDQFAIIDIRVLIKTTGAQDVVVNELNAQITLTVSIPEDERGYKNYRIVRIHDGVAEELASIYNADDHTLTFETDCFSNYAIIYDVSNASWTWWLLLLIIPVGVVGYLYREPLSSMFKKKA